MKKHLRNKKKKNINLLKMKLKQNNRVISKLLSKSNKNWRKNQEINNFKSKILRISME